jgi:hypothetical protein
MPFHPRAARAEPNDIDVRAAGDLARHLDRRQDPPRIDLEIPASLLGAGVSPAQHECLQSPGDGVLDETAPRPQVQEVEAADRRGDNEHRTPPHGRRCRLVLDDLAAFVPVDHSARGNGQIAADRRRALGRTCGPALAS